MSNIQELSLEDMHIGHLDTEAINRLVKNLRAHRQPEGIWLTPDIKKGNAAETVAQALSGLANSATGGSLIVGMRANKGIVTGFRGSDGRELVSRAAALLNAKLTLAFDVCAYSATTELVLVHVRPAGLEQRPCCLRSSGEGFKVLRLEREDGIRALDDRDRQCLQEGRTQPVWDEEIVEDASLKDLDAKLVARYVARQKILARGAFDTMTDEEVLLETKVVRQDAQGIVRPTLAGLLCLGTNPQSFFPELIITVDHYPASGRHSCYLHDVDLTGPIPEMINATVATIIKKMRVASKCKDPEFKSSMEYSRLALRELLVNLVQHRDYSPKRRNLGILITITGDEMEIVCPGSTRSCMSFENLQQYGKWQRNSTLSSILQATPWPKTRDGFVGDIRDSYQFMLNCLDKAGVNKPEEEDVCRTLVLVLRGLWDVRPD